MQVGAVEMTLTSGVTDALDLNKKTIMGVLTPTSLGSAQVSFKGALSFTGDYFDVYDSANALIKLTVDSSSARYYDMTSVFPAGVRYVKLVATGATDSKVLKLIAREV